MCGKSVSVFLGFFIRFLGVMLGVGMLGFGRGRTGVGAHPGTNPLTQDHPSTIDVMLLARLRHDPKDGPWPRGAPAAR